ncbi:colicin E3/pyocin S6 family cytotoxin [Stigmatella sp. ncwal1]|uniref:Colicin E3/pyocin S6 family cytotoxin n=1 Tax=Stigmatella ashevillensis TaxID=2995309 RepID=A0ABT5DF65_9BACT|nr:colicin E3/pyocin S6 family cytotoxin [Stigmatella ashevillena]MDC0712253.1 colicin E3/pyocin S6 family cytotoxin [Stigmatella ashevillena]
MLTELEAMGNDAAQISKARGYIPLPAKLPALPNAEASKPKGTGKLRKRWVDADNGWILEWDYRHGTVEKYDRRGRHLGEFDPSTGKQTKPADPSRKIEL